MKADVVILCFVSITLHNKAVRGVHLQSLTVKLRFVKQGRLTYLRSQSWQAPSVDWNPENLVLELRI